MTQKSSRLYILLLGMAGGVGNPLSSAQARVPGGSPPQVAIPDPDAGGLVALADGGLLSWDRRGHVQTRLPTGAWNAPAQLSVTNVDFVAAGEGGALIVGTRASPETRPIASALFRVTTSGTVAELPVPVDLAINSVSEVGGTVWLSTNRGIEALGPGGVTHLRRSAPSTAVLPSGSRSAAVLCVPADLSAASTAPPSCSSAGVPPWKAAGKWIRNPFVCGEFLVEPSLTVVTIRSLHDGRLLGTTKIPPKAALGCGTGAELLVGARDVVALSLPALALRWRRAAPRQPVTALARIGREIVIFTPRGHAELNAR